MNNKQNTKKKKGQEKEPKIYTCSECDFNAPKKSSVKKHYSQKHSTELEIKENGKTTQPNQYTERIDPRHEKFWHFWTSPHSDTFGNAYKSALRAGFKKNYAMNLATPSARPDWLQRKIEKHQKPHLRRMREKARQNIEEVLYMDVKEKTAIDKGNNQYEIVEKINPRLLKIRNDTDTFVVERLGKNVWSKKEIREDSETKEEIEKLRSLLEEEIKNAKEKTKENDETA